MSPWVMFICKGLVCGVIYVVWDDIVRKVAAVIIRRRREGQS